MDFQNVNQDETSAHFKQHVLSNRTEICPFEGHLLYDHQVKRDYDKKVAYKTIMRNTLTKFQSYPCCDGGRTVLPHADPFTQEIADYLLGRNPLGHSVTFKQANNWFSMASSGLMFRQVEGFGVRGLKACGKSYHTLASVVADPAQPLRYANIISYMSDEERTAGLTQDQQHFYIEMLSMMVRTNFLVQFFKHTSSP